MENACESVSQHAGVCAARPPHQQVTCALVIWDSLNAMLGMLFATLSQRTLHVPLRALSSRTHLSMKMYWA